MQANFRVERGVPMPREYNEGAITVEHNYPMPDFKTVTHKYPWRLMEVGNSFFVPDKKAATFAAYCRDKGKKLGREFRCRDADGGVRVWRTA